MLADSYASDQSHPVQEDLEEEKVGEEEDAEVEQRVPATTTAPEAP